MIALDTNVLLRFLVADDVAQQERAARLIASAIQKEELLFVGDVVMCEAVWVLGPGKKCHLQSDRDRPIDTCVPATICNLHFFPGPYGRATNFPATRS